MVTDRLSLIAIEYRNQTNETLTRQNRVGVISRQSRDKIGVNSNSEARDQLFLSFFRPGMRLHIDAFDLLESGMRIDLRGTK